MKWLFLVFSGVLIFIVIGLGFLYPRSVGNLSMVILIVVLGLSAFIIGRERQGE